MSQSIGEIRSGGVVAGLFDRSELAERALTELKAAGFVRVEISQTEADDGELASSEPPPFEAYDVADESRTASRGDANASTAPDSDPFFQEHDSTAMSFVKELERLNFSKHDAHDLVDGLVKGNALVTADAGTRVDRAVEIFLQNRADIRYATLTNAAPLSGTIEAETDNSSQSSSIDANREIQLRAERLVINKQRVQHGTASVRKEIVTEIKSIDIPVSHEVLVIERHAMSDNLGIDDEPIAEETIRIPLTEERINITKETLVREEVEVGTRRVAGIEHVSDTVRHEELRVDDRPVDLDKPPKRS